MIDPEVLRILAERRAAQPPSPTEKPSLQDNRRAMDAAALALPLPDDVRLESCRIDHVPCEWAIPAQTPNEKDCLLYLHGGAFCVGSIVSHRPLVTRIARDCALPALSVDYRLAPEHGFPAALDDALTAYHHLLQQGYRVIVMGDSAGGSLAAALLLKARQLDLPMAAGLVLLSAWLDLSASGDSYRSNAEHDPFMKRENALFVARGYLKQTNPREPLASPLFGDLNGFPPTLLQVGSPEALLDDSRVFAERAAEAGVAVQLSVWPGMIHVWHALYEELPAARQAVAEIARFTQSLRDAGTQG